MLTLVLTRPVAYLVVTPDIRVNLISAQRNVFEFSVKPGSLLTTQPGILGTLKRVRKVEPAAH